jgi:hypothetical protein
MQTKNAAPTIAPTISTDYTKTVNVKKLPFDGTEASFYLWTTQILGFAETYNCAQALLGTITVPPASAVKNIRCYKAEEPTVQQWSYYAYPSQMT